MTRPTTRGGAGPPRAAGAGWGVVVAALVVGVLSGCTGDPPGAATPSSTSGTSPANTLQDAPSPSTSSSTSVTREGALAALLSARAAAVRDRDRTAFAATLDDPSSGFGLRQLAQYDALAKL